MTDHRVFFDYDPDIKRTVWLVFDDKGQMKGAHVEQDADAIIEANKIAMDRTVGARFGEWNRAASVPLTFLEKTGLGDAIDAGDRRYMCKVLNDGDNAKLRTSRGNV